MTSLKFEAFTR